MYDVDISEPLGFGSLVSGLFENRFLLGIISDNNGQIRARGAVTAGCGEERGGPGGLSWDGGAEVNADRTATGRRGRSLSRPD